MKIQALRLFPLIVFMSGCVTNPAAPTDIGVGKYLQFSTISGSVASQANYDSAISCEINARGHWAEHTNAGYITRCSEKDVSDRLAYRIRIIRSSVAPEANDFLYFSSKTCEKMADIIAKTSTVFENHCQEPFYPTTQESLVSKNSPPAKTSSLEDQLRELKRLFDAGLISKDAYSDRQKKLLGEM